MLRKQLAAILKGASKGDLILVGLAGHGLQPLNSSQNNRLIWSPAMLYVGVEGLSLSPVENSRLVRRCDHEFRRMVCGRGSSLDTAAIKGEPTMCRHLGKSVRMAFVVSCLCLSVQAGRAQESKTPGPKPTAAAGSKEERRPQSAPGVQEPVRRSRVLRSSVIVGASVVPRDGGAALGRVVEFVIGDTGSIEYAVVFDGRRWAAIPWTAATFDFDSRTLRIDIPRNRLGEMPTFANMRAFRDEQFLQEVQTFFRGNSQAGAADPPSSEQRSENGASRDAQTARASKQEPAPKPKISSSPGPQPEKSPAPKNNDAKKSDKGASKDAKAAPASKQGPAAKPKTSSSPGPQPEKPPAPGNTGEKK